MAAGNVTMEWKSDAKDAHFSLEDGGAQLAFVSIKETGAPAKPFRVKTAISFMYFGAARQARLERQRKQWVVTTRKFADRAAADRYAAVKRTEVERYVRAREAAG